MQFISETIIEQVAEAVGRLNGETEPLVAELKQKEPAILAYLTSDGFGILTNPERDYLLYLALVLWRSVEAVAPAKRPVTQDEIGEAEEANWSAFNENIGKKFRDRLDVFFEQTQQEDLLAFIEDALIADEEDEILTKEGREPVFIALKTILDCLEEAREG
ncbi:MAG: hypothetical protein D6714_20090 [Bacteroidetes bacterium]|nr:MAG: hypothetical protein D6714_20090 [Bacteroidota bacterium]